ncbi:hypothetical protein M614_gp05 [Mycobacterium phage BTCU-1]|uniref:Uncharacterized protein n=1 Tax=Mycobacterium phage BTCU-1 TaxID=1262532 RepID=R9R4K0_9CAUD|nr:hypothetical protein M614_gp05 [Mycobacterium phage BTCU-1]AGI61686.1 hypothetical protein CKC_5 [Mycobacterium phage BTCU-1]
MAVTLQFIDPNHPSATIELDLSDFPDASTEAGQEVIEAAIAALNPSPPGVYVTEVIYDTVEVGEDTYPYKRTRFYYTLQDYFDSLSS